jgi:hypothetical protein
MRILAKVIKDRDAGEVIKGIDPNLVIDDKYVAKIIEENKVLQKIKDFDPDSEMESDKLAILVDELINKIKETGSSRKIEDHCIADYIKKLVRAIKAKVTPDIPGLNQKEEGAVIGQLGPYIFEYLMKPPK